MKSKIAFLLIFFIIANVIIYFILKINEDDRIKLVLDDNLETLELHYNIIDSYQKEAAIITYKSTIESKRFIEIMAAANHANSEEKKVLRKELQTLLTPLYKTARMHHVLQYQFLLPNNESFLRMHRPSKFGDDLTNIRDDFKFVNANLQAVSGFVKGRMVHGFRNTFPLFDANHTHIGAMEVSFSINIFKISLNELSKIHTHFLVAKEIFASKDWEVDKKFLQYAPSLENSDYLYAQDGGHYEQERKSMFSEQNYTYIKKKMLQGEKFRLYIKHNNHIDLVSFLPINDLRGKSVAWIVSYTKNEYLKFILQSRYILMGIALLMSLILIFFIIKYLYSKEKIDAKNKLLSKVINETNNIMFITDFKDVKFSNNKFKELFSTRNNIVFNNRSHHCSLDIYLPIDGYLHSGLLKEGENFASLINRTDEEDRIVSIMDHDFITRAFKINVTNVNDQNDEYLVTLNDITKFREKQIAIEKKAYIDGLTMVYNRNKFNELFNEEITRVKRYGHPMSLAIIDIDKFKTFNDTYGHLIGDEVLIMMAQTVNANVRDTDLFARWGGEEFVILFRETELEFAKQIADKLRIKIQEHEHKVAGKITASFGLTQYKENDTIESILERCDKALYKAKENGRNQVVSI